MLHLISGSCKSSREGADVGDESPSNFAGDGRFEILCQSATAAEPCEGSFNDPSAGQDFEGAPRTMHGPPIGPLLQAGEESCGNQTAPTPRRDDLHRQTERYLTGPKLPVRRSEVEGRPVNV